MRDHVDTWTTGRIAAAGREIRSQQLASTSRTHAEARNRERLALIDQFIAVLEERNLDGARRVDPSVRKWLRRLEQEFAVPVPRKVARARTTARLHGALLDWMEVAREEFSPSRQRVVREPELDGGEAQDPCPAPPSPRFDGCARRHIDVDHQRRVV